MGDPPFCFLRMIEREIQRGIVVNIIERCCGEAVDNQESYTEYCTFLLGRIPERMDILQATDHDGCVLFDGECWRKFSVDKLKDF